MPLFRYLDEMERVYPDHPRPDGRGVTGVPGGDPVEMDEPPADGRWERIPDKPKKMAEKTVKATGGSPAEKEN